MHLQRNSYEFVRTLDAVVRDLPGGDGPELQRRRRIFSVAVRGRDPRRLEPGHRGRGRGRTSPSWSSATSALRSRSIGKAAPADPRAAGEESRRSSSRSPRSRTSRSAAPRTTSPMRCTTCAAASSPAYRTIVTDHDHPALRPRAGDGGRGRAHRLRRVPAPNRSTRGHRHGRRLPRRWVPDAGAAEQGDLRHLPGTGRTALARAGADDLNMEAERREHLRQTERSLLDGELRPTILVCATSRSRIVPGVPGARHGSARHRSGRGDRAGRELGRGQEHAGRRHARCCSSRTRATSSSTAGRIASVRRQWQRCVGYVPQSIVLFDDTVRANVALGVARDDVDEDAVWHALELAQLDDVVRRCRRRSTA